MMTAVSDKIEACCAMEKKHLVEALRKCDFCSTSYEDHHRCYRATARESGQRSRACGLATNPI